MSTLAVNEIVPTTGNSIIFTSNVTLNGTGALSLPVGSTADRPTSPSNGMIRYNTTLGKIEAYVGSWSNVSILYQAEMLLVGGGGGGGWDVGGGGGAGGLVYLPSIDLVPGVSYTVTVGSGGAGSTGLSSGPAPNGGNTVFDSYTAIGGGGGGNYNASSPTAPGAAGGSGGGGTGWTYATAGGSGVQTTNNSISTASRTYGYGNPGGSSTSGGAYTGGGGGGAGGTGTVGKNENLSTSFVEGGIGRYYTISGANVEYAKGGRGGGDSWTGGAAGTPNRGNGGDGGGLTGGVNNGLAGGSGIVILKYLGSQRGSGGNVTTDNGYTIHTFTSTSSYTA